MTVLWTSEAAVAATRGRSTTAWEATGVSIDTRTLRPGDLFVALRAARDGHGFVADALSKGAAAALVSHVPEGVAADAPLLVVADVEKALTGLGIAARSRSTAKIIGVTGSVGKTSTKDMLAHMLTRQGRTHAAEASFNNHWGVPLTLARMPQDTEFAVIEIGMNAPGEIAPLAKLARPHVAIVTTVGTAHLAAFENIEGIAREKASIFSGLEPGGTAILNADLPTTPILEAGAGGAKILRFGSADGALCLRSVTVADHTTVVQAEILGEAVLFKIGAPGRHFAMNALAALGAVGAVGADVAIAANDLGRWSPPGGRGKRQVISLDAVEDRYSIVLIDDAYNANPVSVAAALDTLADTRPVDDIGRVARGRRIAILGDMLELGPNAALMHAEIADHPAMDRVAKVHCVGPLMQSLWQALPSDKQGQWVETAEDLASRAHTLVDAGDVVLAKGSKASRVSLVVDAIRNLGHPLPEPAHEVP